MKNLNIICIVVLAFAAGIMATSLLKKPDTCHVEAAKVGQDQHKDEHGHDHGKDSPEKHVDEHGHGAHDDHDEQGEEGVIKLSQDSQELGKIEVATVVTAPLTNKVAVTGRIAQDVENVAHVFPVQAGQLEKCFVQLGSVVKKDEICCVMKSADAGQLIEIKAPLAGIIIAEFVKAGEAVDQSTSLYTIADTSSLWANFDVYEKDLKTLSLGQKILVYPISYPDKKFEGKIVFISPRVDETTYTVKIRAAVSNTDQLLKLGMFVKADILYQDKENYLIVPSDALQHVEGKDIVFVKTAPETFEAREIKIKSTDKDQAAISEGIKEGETVVAKGSFMLKSQLLASEMEHAHSH